MQHTPKQQGPGTGQHPRHIPGDLDMHDMHDDDTEDGIEDGDTLDTYPGDDPDDPATIAAREKAAAGLANIL